MNKKQLEKIIKESVDNLLKEYNTFEGPQKENDGAINISEIITGNKTGYKYNIEINLYPSTDDVECLNGDFEYFIEDHEDETYTSGMLIIRDNEVEDFDGCYDLPKMVKKVLNKHGYTTPW